MVTKVLFVASSGGHLEEISQLKRIAGEFDNALVTEKNGFEVRNFGNRQYYVPQINRKELLFLPKFIALFIKAGRILKKREAGCCDYDRCIDCISVLSSRTNETWKSNLY